VGDGGYAMTKPFWELDPRTYAHGALIYRSEQEYLSAVVPFIAHGLDLDQAVWTTAPARHLRALRSALGTPPALRLVDSRDWYTKPSAPLAGYLSFIEGQVAAGRSVRIAGELVWPWGIAAAREWARYESILNVVLEGLPVQVFCTYNSARLPQSAIDAACATHPSVMVEAGTSPSDRYQTPERWLEDPSSLAIPNKLRTRRYDPPGVLAPVEGLAAEARRRGLDEGLVQTLMAAASDIIANAFAHSGSPVFVAAWSHGDDFICQIEQQGSGPADRLAGYRLPTSTATSGWGLWLARRRSDLVEVGTGRDGTAVRLSMQRPRELSASPGWVSTGL
jgi:DcmR-like sensory protein/histidine kinase-like protein